MQVGKVSFPSVMDIYDVTEMFSRYHIDPTIAQRYVPSKWKVKIHDDGKALLLVMVQNCKKMVLDYIFNVGSVGMSHIWIELDGPPEVVSPLPGTTRSLPTRYWYILPHQLDGLSARMLFGLVGVSSQLVKKVSVGGEPLSTRTGEVIEGASSLTRYDWTETCKLYPAPDIVTGSQRFYRKYGIRESAAWAKCESHFLGDSEVSLKVSPNSAIGKLGFGTSLTGISNPVWVKSCRVKYWVGYF